MPHPMIENCAVALTSKLVSMDTVNPPGKEECCADLLREVLEAAGFSCTLVGLGSGRTNLVARIGNPGKGPPLCFTGHMDVVPLGMQAWQHDPFGAEIVDGCLYGRGSSDMKSGIAAFVCAATKLAPKLHDTAGMLLLITAGEETGCEGAAALVKNASHLLATAGLLLVGEPTGNKPLQGHKGALWLKAVAKGKTAHGSMPQNGDNAAYKLARAALALQTLNLSESAHRVMGAPTVNVGTFHAGININSVPDLGEMTIDVRTVSGFDNASAYSCICRALGNDVELTTLLDLAPVYTDDENPWVQQVSRICKEPREDSAKACTASYFTDAAVLQRALGDPPTLILGPGSPEMAHQTDEYCEVGKVLEGTQIYSDIIRAWCGLDGRTP